MSAPTASIPAKFAPGTLEAELLAQDAVRKCAARLLEGLDAETPQGNPDFRVRGESAERIMNRIEGKPIERQMVQHQHVKSGPTLAELLTTPGAMASLVDAIPPADRVKLARVLAELPQVVEA